MTTRETTDHATPAYTAVSHEHLAALSSALYAFDLAAERHDQHWLMTLKAVVDAAAAVVRGQP